MKRFYAQRSTCRSKRSRGIEPRLPSCKGAGSGNLEGTRGVSEYYHGIKKNTPETEVFSNMALPRGIEPRLPSCKGAGSGNLEGTRGVSEYYHGIKKNTPETEVFSNMALPRGIEPRFPA